MKKGSSCSMFRVLFRLTGRMKFLIVLFCILILVPFGGNDFLIHTMMRSLLFAFMALGFNILLGYTGYLSIGHSAFFGIGAYVAMILALYYEITPWIGIFVGGLLAGIIAVLIGLILFKFRGLWFVLSTVCISMLIYNIFLHWDYVGAAAGLELIKPSPSLYWISFKGPTIYYFIILAFLVIELSVLILFDRTKTAYCLQAIREDEDTAMSMGINPLKYKLIAIFISSFVVGVGGGLYAVKYYFIDPFSVFDIGISIDMLFCVVIGGLYIFEGPLIGALLVIPLSDYMRSIIMGGASSAAPLHRLFYGVALLLVCMYMPNGILEAVTEKVRLKFSKR